MERSSVPGASEAGPIGLSLTLNAGRIQDARLLGDVHISPPEAAATTVMALQQCLEAVPDDVDTAALASRLQAAVPFGVKLVGLSVQSLAIKVRQAIEAAADHAIVRSRIGDFSEDDVRRLTAHWPSLGWHLLPETPLPAALNVALDEVLLAALQRGDRPAMLRFWGWCEPAVILGRCQSVANEVDVDAAHRLKMPIVRRFTGGGAMFVQPHGAITYSLCLPEAVFEGLTLRQSYELCDAWVILGLRSLGLDAHHVPINDIACSRGKMGGAAQARRRGVVLHHTTLAYDLDTAEMIRVLRLGRPQLRQKGVASACKRVAPLNWQTQQTREAVVERLHQTFHALYGGESSQLRPVEIQTAESLAEAKYGSSAWTYEFE